MKCTDCPDYKVCLRQNDLRKKRHKCKKAHEPFVQTNADRFRAMSNQEQQRCVRRFWEIEDFADWLKQPVKEGEDDGR